MCTVFKLENSLGGHKVEDLGNDDTMPHERMNMMKRRERERERV